MAMQKKIIPQGDATLPPPGDERREMLREREDALAEAAEAAGADGGAIDPRAFEIDNEIAQHVDELTVPHADPTYAYRWVQADIRNQWGNRFVTQAKIEGWEVVTHDAPDARGLDHARAVDGTLRVGDVILMRMQIDRYQQMRKSRAAYQKSVETGVTAELEELGRKHAKHGVIIHTDQMDPLVQAAGARAAHAAQIAGQRFDQMLRTGTVPGREVR